MSGGTFTDENGNTFVVTPDGRLIPAGQKKATGSASLDDLKKKAEDEAMKRGWSAVSGASGGGAAGASAAISNTGGKVASSQAENAAWNANADAATAAEAPGLFSFTGNSLLGDGAMGGLDYAPGVAGAAGLYDLYKNPKRIGTGKGYAEGALSGAGIGWTVGGPVGAGVGAGLGLLGNALGIGHESRTKGEQDERAALAGQGVNVANPDVKEWENNPVFAKSRQESDLAGKDIMHAADFYSLIPGYESLDPTKQEAIASNALQNGLIEEKLGKINLNANNPDFQKFVNGQIGAKTGGGSGRARKDAALADIIKQPALDPSLDPGTELGPRYDKNPSSLIRNPYL